MPVGLYRFKLTKRLRCVCMSQVGVSQRNTYTDVLVRELFLGPPQGTDQPHHLLDRQFPVPAFVRLLEALLAVLPLGRSKVRHLL